MKDCLVLQQAVFISDGELFAAPMEVSITFAEEIHLHDRMRSLSVSRNSFGRWKGPRRTERFVPRSTDRISLDGG